MGNVARPLPAFPKSLAAWSIMVAWGTLCVLPSCSKSSRPPAAAGDAAADAPSHDATSPMRDAAPDAPDATLSDAGPETGPDLDAELTPYCAALAVYAETCGLGHAICDDAGPTFAVDCNGEDIAVNSATFEAAEMACFTPANCSPSARAACDYAAFPMHTPTTAQAQLVTDYCAT